MCGLEQAETASLLSADDLDYPLPPELIAQHPLPRRDDARMLLVRRGTARLEDRSVADLPKILLPGDLLVLNDTKVLPAKFTAWRKTGGRVPGLFVKEESLGVWHVMLEGSRRLRRGESLTIRNTRGVERSLELIEEVGQGQWRVRVDRQTPSAEVLEQVGVTPLPPYIRRDDGDADLDAADRRRYQTVYARHPGAIAAPTAGLHLTPMLLKALAERGVETAYVTLHVGIGTFKPIGVDDVSRHVMHPEWYDVPPETAEAIRACRARGGSVTAVGTTAVRALESAASNEELRTVKPGTGATELFIYPPYTFRIVDRLMTNFHLPRSTLLAMVMAFTGIDLTRRAYQHAITQRYRFYSFGDAMLIR